MTRLTQDPQDALDWEQWFAPARHFYGFMLNDQNAFVPPPPGQADGRLKNEPTLRYLEEKMLVRGVRETAVPGVWTYSEVSL